nr:D-alanyl-D-alanine carboxypeptidase [Aliihoeflea sp. 40Bstr573]
MIAGAAGHASANPRYAAYVMDAKTGQVLFNRYGDEQRFPASLTKMMTLYMLFEQMESGRVAKSTPIPISAKAAAEPPTKIGLRAGSTITAENAIYSLVTRSANDIATAIGEFVGGSEQNFARLMTTKARQLGMNSTTFQNAHGLPNNKQVTSARDMAILGIALREHFPQYYSYFSTREFKLGKQRFGNHNRVLGRVRGADGIKTGYIRASGFNLVSSVQDDGRSIVAVVMGGQSGRSRDDHMVELIRQYLPKASRGNKQLLVARGPLSQTVAVAATANVLPTKIPVPQFRPAEEAGAAQMELALTSTAAARPAAQAPAIAPAPSAPLGNDDASNRIQMAFGGALPTARPTPPAPVPSQAVPAALHAAKERAASADVDPVQTSSTQPAGWVIQVASMPSESEAKSFLASAKSRASNVLGGAEPFTETFQHNGQTYYRARFAGFGGKDAAWSACGSLKSYGIACYAVQM